MIVLVVIWITIATAIILDGARRSAGERTDRRQQELMFNPSALHELLFRKHKPFIHKHLRWP
jgi:hypothetical protein